MLQRRCQARTSAGAACRQAPLIGGDYCFWHDPDSAEDAAQARKLGGLRHRRESALGAAYGLEGLDDVGGARRLLEVAITEALTLDNTLARCRVLIAAVHAAARLLEVGEIEARVTALEGALGPRVVDAVLRKRGAER